MSDRLWDGDAESEESVERLQARLDALRAQSCDDCGRTCCGHELLLNVALGASRVRCWWCLAKATGWVAEELRDNLLVHFRRRACYGEVWRRESRREGFDAEALPGCLWPGGNGPGTLAESRSRRLPATAAQSAESGRWTADEVWDAGDTACGDLVLALRVRMQGLPAGGTLKLIAQDSGAREDIPAWCRLTGHTLLDDCHPEYWIRRKEF